MQFFKFFSICFLFILITNVLAQSDSLDVKKIILTDDSEFMGTIVSETDEIIYFKSIGGLEIDIKKSMIKEIKEVEGTWKGGEFRRTDPNQTRLLFAPSARTLPQGRGYFSVYEIFFPMLAYGVTDFVTLAGGMSLFPGVDEQLLYLAPKVRFAHSEQLDISGGILYISAFNEIDLGISYGVISYGSPTASFTGGLGWGFAEGEWSNNPFVMLGAEFQVSNVTKLITENWFPPEVDWGLLSFGIRFFGESLAADFALMTTTEASGSWPFFPWLGFAYNF
jgi:hypothetical protein